MNILDDILVNVKSAAQAVGEKTGDFANLAKLRVALAEIRKELRKKYEELGREAFDLMTQGEMSNESLIKNAEDIKELEQALKAVAEQMKKLKENKK